MEAEVCVIGLGGSGLSAVRELLRRGVDVVGVDAGTVAGGAAGRNGGFLLAGGAEYHHDGVKRWGRERAVRIYHQTLDEIDRFLADLPDLVRRIGSRRVATSQEEIEDCRVQLAMMQEDGLPAEWIDDEFGVGLLIPSDGVFQPLARCRRMAADSAAAGARLFERSPAVSIADGVVETPTGNVRAPVVIVAVDGGLEKLLPELIGRVRTVRLQMLATAPVAGVKVPAAMYARYGFEYWQQLPDGRIALGGLRDRFGDAEETGDAVPSEELQRELERVLREEVGAADAVVTHRWAGAVGYTPDYLPIVEEVRPRVWAIGGYCGTGNLVGAICGRGVVSLALDGDRTVLGGFVE